MWTVTDDSVAIQRAYRKLMRAMQDVEMDDNDKAQIKVAFDLAVDAHSEQRRKSGEPYVLHPIEVARICVKEIGLGPTAVICALLHDVVEDTPLELSDIESKFGPKVTKIVDGLTKLDGTYSYNSPQAENFKKVLSTLVDDVRVVLIKMADRLHNLRTIGSVPRHKQLKVAAETGYIYSPLAHRLGLYNIRTEFQDLCMKITDPEAYTEIALKLSESKNVRTRYISNFIKPIKKSLTQDNIEFRITGRPKSIYSIWNKIKQKNVGFEEIYDLFAIRIIFNVPKEKEKRIGWHVYSIVTDHYTPIPERLKDWITTPKSNGYESLHTTVIGPGGRFVEVQVRSERMDDIAERGFAAHWKYKGIEGQSNMYDYWLDSVREVLEVKHNDAVEFLSDFKSNLFSEEVYTYTPKGDLKVLPKGATALDFAFSIHSDVGYRCTAIKVNNKIVPMGYELQNGDRVEVVTNKSQKPSESWLKMVVTGKARSKIRSSMKEERRMQGETGMESLMRKVKNFKVDFESNIDFIAKTFGFNSRGDLYYAVATGAQDISNLKGIFKVVNGKLVAIPDEEKLQQAEEHRKQSLASAGKRRTPKKQATLLINGEPADQYEFSLAQCCNPVPGDDIFAFTTTQGGAKIHRFTCPNATHLMASYGYRVMSAEFVKNMDSSFVVEIEMAGVDDGVGVIERLTTKISSELGINIRSFSISGDQGYFEGSVKLHVRNTDQLNQAMSAIRKLEGISHVNRVI